MNCKNCGGPYDGFDCDWCGTAYKSKSAYGIPGMFNQQQALYDKALQQSAYGTLASVLQKAYGQRYFEAQTMQFYGSNT